MVVQVTAPLSRAEDLRLHAVDLNNASRAGEARSVLLEAMALIDAAGEEIGAAERHRLRCNCRITLALTEFLLGGLRPARAQLTRAQREAESLGDDDLVARVAYQRANILGRVGDLSGAWHELQAALRRPGAFTRSEMCSVQLSSGMLAFELSKPREALLSFREAASVANEVGLALYERMARHNEGYAVYLLGDLPQALAIMDAAEEIAPDVWLGTVALDRARVLLEAGLLADAIEELEEAGRRTGDDEPMLRAELDLERARAHRLLGQREAAFQAAETARERFEQLAASAWTGKARLVALKIELERQRSGRGSAGIDVVAEARDLGALARSVGHVDLDRSAQLVLGDALIWRGELDEAQSCLHTVQPNDASTFSESLEGVAVLTDLHIARGALRRARADLSRAARRLASSAESSASLDLRTARAVHGVRLARADLDLAVSHGGLAVLESLERWRSATDRMPSLGRPTDHRLAALTEELRAVQSALRSEEGPKAVDMRRRVKALQREIRSRDWALVSAEGAAAVEIRVREARDALHDLDRDLVWLYPHAGWLCGLSFRANRVVTRRLLPLAQAAELAQRIRVDLRTASTRSLGPFSGAVWGSLREAAAQLDDAVLRPWGERHTGLVLVTCEEVSALPWALLPSLRGRPLTVSRSLTSFVRHERRDSQSSSEEGHIYVAVGPGLGRASEEARSVGAAWGSADIADPSTCAGLAQSLATRSVVHVAAHGSHQVQSPLFSSVTMHDGPVFAHELQGSGVRADHVVLSACETGTASFRPGEEQLGLAAALMSLGARSVVAAVSPVPDDVAEATAVHHHSLLARGVSSDEALASAIAANDPVAAAFLNLGGRFSPNGIRSRPDTRPAGPRG